MMAESYRDRTDEQNYALFLNALRGLEDDATIEGYSGEGIDCLRAALGAFQAEYEDRQNAVEKGS